MFRIWGKGILYIEYNGGILSRGTLSGGFCLGGFCPGGILSRGILSGGVCPGNFVLEPLWRLVIKEMQNMLSWREDLPTSYD